MPVYSIFIPVSLIDGKMSAGLLSVATRVRVVCGTSHSQTRCTVYLGTELIYRKNDYRSNYSVMLHLSFQQQHRISFYCHRYDTIDKWTLSAANRILSGAIRVFANSTMRNYV